MITDVTRDDSPKVVSFGGGTNSTAMLILLFETQIRPDLILFADTGGEKPHTYEHVSVVSDWCKHVGFPEIIVVKKRGRVYVGETLEENCLRKNCLPPVAYGFKTCSIKYKVQPQDMFLNNWDPAKDAWKSGNKVVKYIGFDADEGRRVKHSEDVKYANKYPLISADWGREECVDAIARHNLPQPGKSACFFCPSSKKHEILELRDNYPDLMRRALAMEDQAQLTSVKGLGRRFSWRAYLEGQDVSESRVDTPCGCYDG